MTTIGSAISAENMFSGCSVGGGGCSGVAEAFSVGVEVWIDRGGVSVGAGVTEKVGIGVGEGSGGS